MDIRFVAHRAFIDNEENLSSKELLHALTWALPKRFDTLERMEEIPNSLGELKNALGITSNEELTNIVPIGDLRFVSSWLALMPNATDPSMTPLEIPPSLRKFACRKWRLCKGKDIPADEMDASRYFVKDADTLKKWNSLLYDGEISGFIELDTTYAISEKVNFLSEWRVFVNDGRIVGAENYLGDPILFPSRETIYDIVRTLENSHEAPGAYTLDVGVMSAYRNCENNGIIPDTQGYVTVPIEVHPFVACGLYGFSDPRELPDMLARGYNWYFRDAPDDLRELRFRDIPVSI